QGSALPAVVVTCVYEDQDIVLAGPRRGYMARIEVSCVGASVAEADELAEAVKDALEIANAEIMSDDSPASVEARVNYIVKDGADVSDYSDDRTVFRRIADYRMRWTR